MVLCCHCCSSLSLYPDTSVMSLTEEADRDTEYSMLKTDAGCTPKLSRRKSVANDCGRNVVEIVAKNAPGLCHTSSSSSWLCAVRKSTKHTVENRKRGCCSPLQLPSSKIAYSTGYANKTPMMACNNNNEATSLHDEYKRTLSPHHLKVC